MKPYYDDGKGIVLYNADCRELAPLLATERDRAVFDLMLSDFPYGIKADSTMAKQSGQQHGRAAAPKGNYTATNWDDEPPDKATIDILIGMARQSILWGGNYFDLPPMRGWLVWDKCNGENNFADAELAWTNIDMPFRLKRHLWNGMLRKDKEVRLGHPTQKPINIISWALSFAPAAKTCFDPYCGSGTTLVACKERGVSCIGIEMQEAFCEMTARRLQQDFLPLAPATATPRIEEPSLL